MREGIQPSQMAGQDGQATQGGDWNSDAKKQARDAMAQFVKRDVEFQLDFLREEQKQIEALISPNAGFQVAYRDGVNFGMQAAYRRCLEFCESWRTAKYWQDTEEKAS